ncbi:MAG TPA: uracil-DNA glycosylase [Dehalococcoidia bacterium]|nr:uracil-DNA glycosylase [Dehalococcoidia bacterium]
MSTLEEIALEVAECQRCPLGKLRTRAVPGEGPPNAEVLFIGEAPGWHEDQQGRPFVGPAGQLLDQLLALAGLRRSEVFITNIIKSRPPNNRDPLPAEVEACRPWLDAQLAALNPRVVVTLGRYSAARYFPREPMSRIHGQSYQREGMIVVPMYHPAAALHQGSLRATIETDFRKLPAALAQARALPRSAEAPEERPQQLSLF